MRAKAPAPTVQPAANTAKPSPWKLVTSMVAAAAAGLQSVGA